MTEPTSKAEPIVFEQKAREVLEHLHGYNPATATDEPALAFEHDRHLLAAVFQSQLAEATAKLEVERDSNTSNMRELLRADEMLGELRAKLKAAELELVHTREAAELLRSIPVVPNANHKWCEAVQAWHLSDQRQPVASGAEEPVVKQAPWYARCHTCSGTRGHRQSIGRDGKGDLIKCDDPWHEHHDLAVARKAAKRGGR